MSNRRSLRSRPNSESQGLGQCHLCCEQDSNEQLFTCNICANQFHPLKCLLLSESTVTKILDKSNNWSCNKCKSCEICRRKKDLRSVRKGGDKTLILCKGCDKGFHRNCIKQKKSSSFTGTVNSDDFCCQDCLKECRVKEENIPDEENEVVNEAEDDDDEDDDDEEDADALDEEAESTSDEELERKITRVTRSKAKEKKADEDSSGGDEGDNVNESKKILRNKPAPKNVKNQKSKHVAPKSSKRKRADDEDNVACKKEEDDVEEVQCPVPGCDSKGHLSGKFETHVTMSTCPLFHNLTPEDCIERYERRSRRRETAEQITVKSSLRKTPIKEEKYHNLIEHRRKDMCSVLTTSPTKRKENLPKTNNAREPNIRNLTPIFDFEMFREAQARAAELLQEQLKDVNSKRHGIKNIEMGKYEMEVWYSSPYPEEYLCLPKIYICEFCLKYFNSRLVLKRHMLKCPWHCPPGDEIYRKANISIFEIDGEKNKFYCQNLCLVAKLFLDHKTLYYDVEPFKFYIMTECDSEGFHIIGYFSKEKNSFLNYNVSCILTFPPYQKQGYGRMLIDFSYLLTKMEGKVGSPEKPLSDLGLISYRSYWKNVILEYLSSYEGSEISIKDLSQETAINAYDIVSTLQALGMLKYWKGKHLVLTRKEILDEYRAKLKKRKNAKTIDESCLRWQPSTNCVANTGK